MRTTIFTVPPQDSWFARGTKHHIGLPPDLVDVVRAWAIPLGLERQPSVRVDIFANETPAKNGALNFSSGYLTGVKTLFNKLSIRQDSSERPTLLARLHFLEDKPQIFRILRRICGRHSCLMGQLCTGVV